MSTKPITPDEARKSQPSTIPPEVFGVFNDLLKERAGSSGSITITQEEVMKELLLRMPHIERHQIFEKHWLDIETAYRKAGWEVEYDKPAYNETYGASWEFKHGKRSEG